MAAGKYAIGVDSDQALSLPEYAPAIITSSQKVIDVAVLDLIKKNAGGDLGGENYVGTLANDGVALAPYHDFDSKISPETHGRARSAQGGHRRPAPSRSPTTSSSHHALESTPPSACSAG